MDMTHEQADRRVPLAHPFGRQVRGGGRLRDTVLSAVVHVLVIGILVWGGRKAYIDATRGPGPDLGRGGGGGGGGIRTYAIFSSSGSSAQAPTPTPVPPPIAPAPVTPPTTIPPPALAPAPEPSAA